MPELPEVETVTRALRPHLINRTILQTVTGTRKLRNFLDIDKRDDILGPTITNVRRRAKYILVELENLKVIVIHLGMSGSCRLEPSQRPARSHDHVSWYLDNGMVWRLNDPRKFGLVKVDTIDEPGALPGALQQLPPEPLSADFSPNYLAQAFQRRTKAVKAILMDSQLVVGIGNIYACESLFLAGINPTTAGGIVSTGQIKKLIVCIQVVLTEAIQAGGTTIADFKSVDGQEGKFSRKLRVYGKENERCARCNDDVIRRIVISGRSTYYCPRCQQ